jgi:endoglucanase
MKTWNGYMRGINLGGWISQCPRDRSHYDSFITEKDIRTIASWGLDHVRLPIDNDVVSDEEGKFTEGIKYVDNCIEWCRDNGLNIILDLHKAPGYAFYIHENTLFKDTHVQDTFINLWKEFAARYGGYGDFVSFELLNEVVDAESSLWNSLIKRAICEIRKTAPDIKIVVGGIRWNSASTLELLDPPYDENIVFTYHCYDPFLFTHQGAQWIEPLSKLTMQYPGNIKDYRRTVKKLKSYDSEYFTVHEMGTDYLARRMAPALNIAQKYDVPVYCGEYGVILSAPADGAVNWYKDISSVFEKYGIARAAWTYRSMSFGVVNWPGDTAEQIIRHL